ncbi:hypothetical protein BDR04DRAFT_1112712 [Suillus decipiens]|nr:hypothetical protein BDR04DRAFT_1112712 [Suillus decipiens]
MAILCHLILEILKPSAQQNLIDMPLIPLSEAISNEELEQQYLLAAPTKALKCPSAPTAQLQKASLKKKTKAGGKGKAPTKPEPDMSLSRNPQEMIEEAITRKLGAIKLDDPEWDEGKAASEIEGKDILDLLSVSDEEVQGVKEGLKRAVMKAFHANSLLEPSIHCSHTTATSETLSSLTSVFNLAVIKEHDETQLSSLKCCCADHAESQVEMLKLNDSGAGPSETLKVGTNGLDELALIAANIAEKDNHGPK